MHEQYEEIYDALPLQYQTSVSAFWGASLPRRDLPFLSLAGVADDLFEDGGYLVARGVDVGEEDVSPSSAFCHGVSIWVFVQIMATLRQSRTNLIGIGILPIEGERPALVRLDGIYAA